MLAFLVIPLALGSRGTHRHALPLLYFVAVGLGYILVEIAFIQRFVLFLGHPTYALTVVIFLMLLSSGLGSLASRNWLGDKPSAVAPLILIIAAILLYVFVLPALLNAFVGLRSCRQISDQRSSCWFLLGLPWGCRSQPDCEPWQVFRRRNFLRMKTVPTNESAVEWAWAMNAASSVLGSVLAMVIAIQFGLNITLACGAVAYFLALILTKTVSPRTV